MRRITVLALMLLVAITPRAWSAEAGTHRAHRASGGHAHVPRSPLFSPRTSSTTCAPANYKTLTQIMSEFRTCSDQGLSPQCLTQGNVQDLICSARKLTSGDWVSVTPVGGTYTLDFNTGINFSLTLVHASCPCTVNVANPQNQIGWLEIIQSSTGSDTIGTWTNFLSSTLPTLSTAPGAKDYVSYGVNPAGQYVLGAPVLNAH